MYPVSERVILTFVKVYHLVQIRHTTIPLQHDSPQKVWGHVDLGLALALPQQLWVAQEIPTGTQRRSQRNTQWVYIQVCKTLCFHLVKFGIPCFPKTASSVSSAEIVHRDILKNTFHAISCLKCFILWTSA